MRSIRSKLCIAIGFSLLAGCAATQTLTPHAVSATNRRISETNGYKLVFSFPSKGTGCPDGALPEASLISVSGILYGTTVEGGTNFGGTIFSLTRAGAAEILYSFPYTGKGGPTTPLTELNGSLWGASFSGGRYGYGMVFNIGIYSRNFAVVHSFGESSTDGKTPLSGLTYYNHRLYGTTAAGGAHGAGTVYSVDPSSGSERVDYSFRNHHRDGTEPHASVLAVSGELYGTTSSGGVYGDGTVFSLDPATNREKVLHDFSTYSDGQDPEAPVIVVNGILYGTTAKGGTYGLNGGTLFRISRSGKGEKVVHNFGASSDGQSPYAPVLAVRGVLYGTTALGGVNGPGCYYSCGTIYSVNIATNQEKVLHSFGAGNDGADPLAGLTNVLGTLYGTTTFGGIVGGCVGSGLATLGTVFSLKP